MLKRVWRKGSPLTLLVEMQTSTATMAPHCSTLAWKIPWMEEPGGLQSMGLLRVGHDWVTSLSLFTFMHWRRKWQPTPVFLPGAWWAAVYGVTQSQTQLKWLSSSSSSIHCWWECKLGQPLWRTVCRFLKKLEIELPYHPAIPLLGIHT